MDPRRLWDFLERIGAVSRPLTGNERERESANGAWHQLTLLMQTTMLPGP